MKSLLTAALLAALFSGTAEAAPSQARIMIVPEAVWSDGDNPPITEQGQAEWVNDRNYISMMSCRRALEGDHAVYAAQTAKEFKFIQGSKNHGAKHLIKRSSSARCWIGPLPTQDVQEDR